MKKILYICPYCGSIDIGKSLIEKKWILPYCKSCHSLFIREKYFITSYIKTHLHYDRCMFLQIPSVKWISSRCNLSHIWGYFEKPCNNPRTGFKDYADYPSRGNIEVIIDEVVIWESGFNDIVERTPNIC